MKKSIEQYLEKNKGNISEATVDLLTDTCKDLVDEKDTRRRISIWMETLTEMYKLTVYRPQRQSHI